MSWNSPHRSLHPSFLCFCSNFFNQILSKVASFSQLSEALTASLLALNHSVLLIVLSLSLVMPPLVLLHDHHNCHQCQPFQLFHWQITCLNPPDFWCPNQANTYTNCFRSTERVVPPVQGDTAPYAQTHTDLRRPSQSNEIVAGPDIKI